MQKQCDAGSATDTDESCTNRRQHVDAQEQYNADNVDEPDVVPNPVKVQDGLFVIIILCSCLWTTQILPL